MTMTVYQPPDLAPDEPARENAVRRSGVLDIRDDPVLDALVDEAQQLMAADAAAISIVYREWQYLVAARGMAPGVYGRRRSFCGHAILQDEAVFVVGDTQTDPRFAGNPNVRGMSLRFYAGARLLTAPGIALGALCVFGQQPRAALLPAERQRLPLLAGTVMRRLDELRHG